MSLPSFGGLRRPTSLPPVATTVAALIAGFGSLDLLAGGLATRLFGLITGGEATLLEPWRAVTFGLVSSGLLGTVLAAVFGFWILSSAERVWGSAPTALAALSATLTMAAVAAWFIPFPVIMGGASTVAWGVICALTYHLWRRGANVRDQLVILALCGLLVVSGGALSIIMTLAAAVGGVAAAHLLFEVKLPSPTAPADPYEAFKRARQGKAARKPPSSTMLVAAWCALMFVVWAARAVIGG